MADFELSEEYQDLSNTVREFADEVVAPVSAKHDEEHSFPYEVVSQMADMGLFGLPFPEESGGMGGDYFALALALEQLGRVDQSVAITLEAGVSLGAMPSTASEPMPRRRNGCRCSRPERRSQASA